MDAQVLSYELRQPQSSLVVVHGAVFFEPGQPTAAIDLDRDGHGAGKRKEGTRVAV